MTAIAERPRFTFLLVALFVEVALLSFVPDLTIDVRIARGVTAVVFLVAAMTIGARNNAVLLLFFLPAFVAQVASTWIDTVVSLVVAAALRLVFVGVVGVFIGREVFRGHRVTSDTLAGVACVYLLLGMAWASLYIMLELSRPGSFAIPPDWIVGGRHDPTTALTYFSFATLTTVGYVIHPVRLQAAVLSVMEAVVGQLYLAIMIGRMVGMHIAQRSD